MDESRAGDDIIRIETPEHVVFEYELAGLGSRMLAAMMDVLIIVAILAGILILLMILGGGVDFLRPYLIAGAAVAAFVTLWGYPIFFELYMRGQTPGKRVLRMRVIQEGGYALTPAVVLVRNLLRVVDFLPGGYFLGLAVMVCNRKYKRIGDFAAGTIVIRDRREAIESRTVSTRQLESAANREAAAELRRAGVHQLTVEQVRLIEDFLTRRVGLEPEARRRIARQVAESIGSAVGQTPPPNSERFLQSVLLAHRQGQGEAEAAPPAETEP